MITTEGELTGPWGVLRDADLISGNKDLENSFDDGALDRDYLAPKLQRAERQAEDLDSPDATTSCENTSSRHQIKTCKNPSEAI